ncbi:efflux RND transporter permease subunit [Eilatimonas milleporae]|uniref:Efflux pump membrane transporter n=1 Tax=Eilatimonas milleporae TaxID=911205 RepID=A0A3M0CWJ1_9PROT|nr:multidrug efflux RND transporter permease subunit [Eilatimonas milleporae]RMB08173.1 hydrophobe/amphiphile efflux-1 (HAE1) family protein [Eilatimonas milleporae]
MKFTHTFIERPIFATVLSILIVLVGAISYFRLPVAQYPDIAPPTIQVTANYPGADALTVARTVATPLEQEINGVEGMLYMSSQSTNDGSLTLTITFGLGADLNQAQVLVQNRVAVAEPRLPEEVRRLGVTTQKNSPDLMMVVHLLSPDNSLDQLYIANYAILQIRDRLARIDGVGDIFIFGASEYSMRVWLDPDRIASVGLTAEEVVATLQSQNIQVASGVLNDEPLPARQGDFELSVQTQGRLVEPEQFEDIVIKSDVEGRITRLGDVGRVELGAADYATKSYLDGKPAIALVIFQRPGTNALETATALRDTMEGFKPDFPQGLDYDIVYNPTEFISQSISAVLETLMEAVILVVLVIVLFLQKWRAALIPSVAIPVSLIGTFAVMSAFGFSLNNLTLFGLVLAIGIVVDDAIVVVENVERNLREGKTAREAAHITMDEVGTALIATSLALIAVFLPASFIGGISGQFFSQFALTIAVATVLSTVVSLTLSPALCAIFLKGEELARQRDKPRTGLGSRFSDWFNGGLDRVGLRYGGMTGRLTRRVGIMFTLYAGLMALAYMEYQRVPGGFIPEQDKGYFIIAAQLPPGAALSRTDDLVLRITEEALAVDGLTNAVAFAGFSGATFTNASNSAAVFVSLEEFDVRQEKGLDYYGILNDLRQRMMQFREGFVVVIPPPPVEGIGSGGGWKMMIQDRGGRGERVLFEATQQLAGAAWANPAVSTPFSFFEVQTPQLFVDIDRARAEILRVPVANVFNALEVYLGSSFVNDFNYLGRTYRVTAQADAAYRLDEDDIARLRTRNQEGGIVPIGSVATFERITGPSRMPRYNLFPAAELQGDTAPGYATGEALASMEALAEQILPPGISYEWTELAYQQKNQGDTSALVYTLAVVFVFLVLAAQFESWLLPLAIILIVPVCFLSAMIGVDIAGFDNNLLTQIGLVVLVGLASKNAILIVEFARQLEDSGRTRFQAAVEAAKLRLRPILMTSFSFILGVVPLVIATGAGAEMRQALGVVVFSGMIGVTLLGLVFTPVFYVACRSLASDQRKLRAQGDGEAGEETAETPAG